MIILTKMKKQLVLAAMIGLAMCLAGCSAEVSNVSHAQEKKYEDKKTKNPSLVGAYDSADQAVIEDLNTDEKQITLMNLQTGGHYTLYYSGTSYIMDKYGSSIAAGQLKQGQIVDVTFLKSNRQINQLQVSDDAWKYEEVSKYDLTRPNNTATIGNAVFSLNASTRVFSNGRQADLMDIVKGDVLTISGVGHEIYSIQIEKGHGYVRLKNDAGLQGGWIEIGNEVITKVTSENMLLAVPEGNYTIKLRTDSDTIMQDVTVERNQELVLDCSKIKVKEDLNGYVSFHLQPSSASLSIDGEKVDYPDMVRMSYGIHEIEVEAPGYQTLLKHISVGTKLSEISIILEESQEDETEDDAFEYENENADGNSGNKFESDEIGLPEYPEEETVSKNTISKNVSSVVSAVTSNKVYVDEPKKTEVFLDGIYVGLTPTSFKKTTGTHTLTLRKSGYVTRSYTVIFHDDGEDITYSFSDLEAEDDETQVEEKNVVEIIVEPNTTDESDTNSTDEDDKNIPDSLTDLDNETDKKEEQDDITLNPDISANMQEKKQ